MSERQFVLEESMRAAEKVVEALRGHFRGVMPPEGTADFLALRMDITDAIYQTWIETI